MPAHRRTSGQGVSWIATEHRGLPIVNDLLLAILFGSPPWYICGLPARQEGLIAAPICTPARRLGGRGGRSSSGAGFPAEEFFGPLLSNEPFDRTLGVGRRRVDIGFEEATGRTGRSRWRSLDWRVRTDAEAHPGLGVHRAPLEDLDRRVPGATRADPSAGGSGLRCDPSERPCAGTSSADRGRLRGTRDEQHRRRLQPVASQVAGRRAIRGSLDARAGELDSRTDREQLSVSLQTSLGL